MITTFTPAPANASKVLATACWDLTWAFTAAPKWMSTGDGSFTQVYICTGSRGLVLSILAIVFLLFSH